jgi:uncharacterized repeat protein (TIGR03803 family)
MTRKKLVAAIGKTTIGRTLIATALALSIVPGSSATSGKEHRFVGAPDGAEPASGLVSDGAGNFYGTTDGGGVTSCGFSAPFCGTVFKMSVGANGTWKETILHRFEGGNDGAAPSGTLVFDSAGNLYGTTVTGGNNLCNQEGCGTVFEMSPGANGTWTETILYRFLGDVDAQGPGLGVVFDAEGNLYGAAGGGCQFGCNGTIFKLASNHDGTWTESIIYTFEGGTDGGFPSALVFDGAGNLYGTTSSGGVTQPPCSCGTVFELSLSPNASWEKTILYSFHDGLDGGSPSGAVAFDHAGNLFGETYDGGSFACPQSGCGVVYELSPESVSWKFSVTYIFNGFDGSLGSQPSGGLALDSSGNMYGTTGNGGDLACNNGNGCGTIFELSPRSGGGFTFGKLYAFTGNSGADPNGGVIVDSAGKLYGTTFAGGDPTCLCGVVFSLTP